MKLARSILPVRPLPEDQTPSAPKTRCPPVTLCGRQSRILSSYLGGPGQFAGVARPNTARETGEASGAGSDSPKDRPALLHEGTPALDIILAGETFLYEAIAHLPIRIVTP